VAWSGAGAWGRVPPHTAHWASPYHGGHPVLGAGGGSNTEWQTVWGPQAPAALAFSPYRGPFPPPPLPPEAALPPEAQEQDQAARGAQGQAHPLVSHEAGVQGHEGERQGRHERTEEQRQSTQPVQPVPTSPRPSAPRAEEAGQQGLLSSAPNTPNARKAPSTSLQAPNTPNPPTTPAATPPATFAAPSSGATSAQGISRGTWSKGVETSQGAEGATGQQGPGAPQDAGEMPEGAPSRMELRLAHAKWNVRAYAYQELACAIYRLSTTAGRADVLSDTLSEWATFLPLVSQALLETNVVALDRALNAGQQFLEHAPLDMCVELAVSSAQVPAALPSLPCSPMRSCRGSGVKRGMES